MSERKAEGYDIPQVEQWIETNIPALSPPFNWTQLVGGHSNLTYKLVDTKGQTAVIRRPPQGKLLPKAHDMSREWALISSLGSAGFPVPRAYGFCESPDVTGAWFYVMGHVEGRPLYSVQETMDWIPDEKRETLAYSFIDTLADLHRLDPDEIGLGDFGKKDGYLARQLKTWYRSWTASVEPAQFDDPRAHELHQYFIDEMPDQGMARVVHGDYGLHNCLVGDDSTIAAVVDWELASLGDPLVDLGYALNMWPESQADIDVNPDAATAASGFPKRSELADRYAKRTGRSLENLDYYLGYNSWKLATIVHGVYARYKAGQKSSDGVDMDRLIDNIQASLDAAEKAVNRLKR